MLEGRRRRLTTSFSGRGRGLGFSWMLGVVEGRRRAGSISCLLTGASSGTSSLRLRFEHMAQSAEEESRRQAEEERLRRQAWEQRLAQQQVSQDCLTVSSKTCDTDFSSEPCSSVSFCLVS